MELLQLDIFDDDLNAIDNSFKQRLKKAIVKIRENPRLGKPLKHYADIFSERVGKFRLVYKFQNQEITLICFKHRDEVYEYVRKLMASFEFQLKT